MSMKNPISEEQAKAITEEYRQLVDAALQQLSEHKQWLKEKLIDSSVGTMSLVVLNTLVYMVDHITLETVYAEPNVTQLVLVGGAMVQKKTLSLVWQYPEELLTFLMSPSAPEELRASLNGASIHGPEDQPAFTIKQASDTELLAEAEKAKAQQEAEKKP